MSRYFVKDGEPFMRVTAATFFLRSSMIKDILTTGGELVVNLNTGILTVNRGTLPEEITHVHKIRAYYKPNGLSSIKLSDDLAIAQLQLSDHFSKGECHGKVYWTASNNSRRSRYINGNLDDASYILEQAYHEYPDL